ncbi:MAG: hypothetical protein AB7S71_22870 [Dongiaceae bacterium]
MQKSLPGRWSLMAAVGTMSILAGFMSHMDPMSIRPVQAGEATATSSSSASASSSASSSSSGDGCRSETQASAEATTVVDGETKTVRQDDADRSEECGGRAESKANARIDGRMPESGESGQ